MYPVIYSNSSLIVICGATATGKSSLAIALAKRLKSIIISADSRQVYREFDIGTAKPTLAEQQEVPHYLIDICEPVETLTVADYQQQAQGLINSVSLALLVGGTGLYIRSIVKGLKIPRVAPNNQLRSQLQQLGQIQLYAMLQQIDPIAGQKIHANDAVRTLRALEVYYVTGSPISEQQGENPPNYPILQIGLDCPNLEDLHRRIKQRTEQMIGMGLVAEVEFLGEKYGFDLPLLNTLGYQEIKEYLLGNVSLSEAKDLIVLHTRQFAKRQRTWFKACPEIEWFNCDDSELVEKVWEQAQEFVKLL
ncbi:MAG: tRNA (adenosine(37)-N6)-dimethylallyltransferase MiaA [Chroococcus sp. CMT-3BRIN-NPC107]|jgi:tRNA dimethylallyltransferase|nr:tRNA (adenosine(37)-N6)-dimethylallyltransferase MiaA [Chroococcus sp. CMT-3BRIN-NPC107]